MIQTQVKNGRAITRSLQRKTKRYSVFDIIIRTNGVELNEKLRQAITTKIGRVRQYAPKAFRARVHLERAHMKVTEDQFRVLVRYEIPGADMIAEHHLSFRRDECPSIHLSQRRANARNGIGSSKIPVFARLRSHFSRSPMLIRNLSSQPWFVLFHKHLTALPRY